jgi:hypothetical protein
MMKALTVALATAGAVYLAVPAANAAPRQDGLTQDMSAQTVRTKTVVRKRGNTTVRTTTRVRSTRTYPAPSYYGYYGPTYYERPYQRPAPVVFSIGGWW